MIVNYIISNLRAVEIWPIEEVKNYLRISHDYDDQLIANLIKSAIDSAELFTGLSLNIREIICKIDALCRPIRLKYLPILEIEEILQTTYNRKKNIIDCFGHISSNNFDIHFANDFRGEDIEIKYKSGYREAIPRAVCQGILMHIASMYEHTEDGENLNAQIKDLYSPYRMMKI